MLLKEMCYACVYIQYTILKTYRYAYDNLMTETKKAGNRKKSAADTAVTIQKIKHKLKLLQRER